MKTKWKKHFFFLMISCILITLTGCLSREDETKRPPQKLELRIGAGIVEQIKDSNQIFVARTIKNEEHHFLMASKEYQLSDEQANELKKMLLNDNGYLFDKSKKCLFIPGAAFRFHDNQDTIIMVNLFCNQIKFINKERSFILDYDPMAGEFNAFCRGILENLGE